MRRNVLFPGRHDGLTGVEANLWTSNLEGTR